MVDHEAVIRPYRSDDEKLVKFTVGKAVMEALAVANRRAAFHPLTLSVWVAASCIMIQSLGWWPEPEHGWLGWLSPLPAFGCLGFAILFALDWINRPYFEELTSDVLHRPDLADIHKYYARSPSSGIFILEYGSRFIGLIAIDASTDSRSNQSFVKKTEDGKFFADKSKDFYSKGTTSTATIRHFYVEEPFRKSEVQNDLLQFAARHAFTMAEDVQGLETLATPLLDYVYRSLGELGFTVEKHISKVGVYGWTLDLMSLEKVRWKEDEGKRPSI
ncbi:hypothetical protein PAXRUDRAFT_153398 [Paxillus rubicundulus Ve08.2h10]|uniref:N-acetyltransferase domain-containing protein n=1 Tax=Paxillus rubicundulus Ve08.2h10 TaxID=930991 RepID=A0A0D0D449_9AGAM|nr:hypothetical protein PAXRUDRAFT_153398 [Paxillus rubicundulus Ve08.2h10]